MERDRGDEADLDLMETHPNQSTGRVHLRVQA